MNDRFRRLRLGFGERFILIVFLCGCFVPETNLTQSQLNSSDPESFRYQKERDQWMRSEESPLALAGLFWLKPGENTLGTEPSNQIILPPGSAPAKVGRLFLKSDRVHFESDPGAIVLFRGSRITTRDLQSDASGAVPDLLSVGELRMKVIKRGDRLGLRISYSKNPALLNYHGLAFFQINSTFRVVGRFSPYHPPKKIQVANVLGQVEELECPGVVRFSLQGKSLQLEPVLESPDADKLFFMFKDKTNGNQTYEAGRYLYADLPSAGKVILDFNQSHNPYCAYTKYSTCQIPPLQNWLKVPIPAGEKKYQPAVKKQ